MTLKSVKWGIKHRSHPYLFPEVSFQTLQLLDAVLENLFGRIQHAVICVGLGLLEIRPPKLGRSGQEHSLPRDDGLLSL